MRAAMMGGLAVLALSAPGLAQVQSPPDEGAVVRELVVTPLPDPPPPKVGPGAPQLTVSDIAVIAEEARDTVVAARSAMTQCKAPSVAVGRPTGIREMLGQAYGAERDAAQRVRTLADGALAATEAARQARMAGGDPAPIAELELARQKAVNDLVVARNDLDDAQAAIPIMQRLLRDLDPPPDRGDASNWQRSSVDRVLSGVSSTLAIRQAERVKKTRPGFENVVLHDIVVRELQGKEGPYLQVTGKIRNDRPRAVAIPPLQISQFDDSGFLLDEVEADPGRGNIAPAQSKAFRYEITPRARMTRTVRVTFVSGPQLPPRLPPGAPLTKAQAMPSERMAPPGMLAGGHRGLPAQPTGGGVFDCSAR